MRTNPATALNKRIDGLFAGAARTLMLALAAVFVLFEFANESVVHFDCFSFTTKRHVGM